MKLECSAIKEKMFYILSVIKLIYYKKKKNEVNILLVSKLDFHVNKPTYIQNLDLYLYITGGLGGYNGYHSKK